MAEKLTVNGRCHCSKVHLKITLIDGFNTASRCNCSICRMRGAVVVTADIDDLEIVNGHDLLTLYQFNTREAKHYFCSKCGIYTHHQRRSNPDQYSVNVAIIEGYSPFDFAEVIVTDGIHHSRDNNGISKVSGVLTYKPKPHTAN